MPNCQEEFEEKRKFLNEFLMEIYGYWYDYVLYGTFSVWFNNIFPEVPLEDLLNTDFRYVFKEGR